MLVKRNTITNELILCPNCEGKECIRKLERVSLYETEELIETCYLCKGKRVVNKKVTLEYETLE